MASTFDNTPDAITQRLATQLKKQLQPFSRRRLNPAVLGELKAVLKSFFLRLPAAVPLDNPYMRVVDVDVLLDDSGHARFRFRDYRGDVVELPV